MRPARIREVRGRLTRAPVMVRAGLFAELDLMHGAEIYGTIGGIDGIQSSAPRRSNGSIEVSYISIPAISRTFAS
jgi:hypothetical protein